MGVGLWHLLLIGQALCWSTVIGYPDGRVTGSCGSMVPQHGRHAAPGPPPTPPPYTLTLNTSHFSPGDNIRVTLSGTTYFTGFLLQARDATSESGGAVGSFTLTNHKASQLLTCNHIQGSAVSHTSDARQTDVQVIWTAPPQSPATLHFLVTVVTHYKVYYVKVPSPVISQDGVTPTPSTPPTGPSTTPPSTCPFSSEGCGQRKSCLLDPVGCDPEVDPNCYFLSMTPDPEGQTVGFELSGPAEGYVSFALSWDQWMGDDEVYVCVRDGGGRVDVNSAYVTGRTHPQEASQNVLTDVAWRLADGVIQCRFRRPVHIPQDQEQDQTRFSLDQPYYLFIAHGTADYGEIHRHQRQPLISSHRKLITGPPDILIGSRSPLIMKYHGLLMLIGWVLIGSTGTVIASFYKPDWPEKTLLGQKVWFQVHRGFMVLTVLLTAVAFILPFIYRAGWSKRAGAHPYLGCTVLALALLQPITAAFRPAPDSSRRWVFNWIHRGAGTAAEIMAVAAIFLGVSQQAVLLPLPWAWGVLGGYVAWGALFRLLLTLHQQGYIKTPTDHDDQQSILPGLSESSTWDSVFKMAALAVFVVGNGGFLVALISSIASL